MLTKESFQLPSSRPEERLNIKWIRTTRRNRCPICDKYGWCEISDDQSRAHCMHQSSGHPMNYRNGGWLHFLKLDFPTYPRTSHASVRPGIPETEPVPDPVVVVEIIEPLEPAKVDEINRALLDLCPLSDQHRQYLADKRVPTKGCGSLAKKDATQIAHLLVKVYGEEIARRHPALCKVDRANGRNYWTLASADNGLLLPATNVDGLILGIQIRKDKPKDEGDRYRWLSHNGLGGTPLTVFKAGPGTHHVIITEGYKKAALAHQIWQSHTISLAGVSAYRDSELIAAIEGLGEMESYTVAFDQDKRTKSQVKKAERKLLNLLAANFPNAQPYFLNWNIEDGKGLDDAYRTNPAGFGFEKPTEPEGPRLVNDLPGQVLSRQFGSIRPLYTLDEARSMHRELFNQFLMGGTLGKCTAVTSPTGTGKSTNLDNALADYAHIVDLLPAPGRVLLLSPNKKNIEERTSPTTQLGQAVLNELVTIQQGRQPLDLTNLDQQRSTFDCANPQAQEAGAARQVTAQVICKDCIFGSDKNWRGAGGGGERLFKCEKEGYLASQKVSREANVVIATKEAYLNNSNMIDDFDLIICDEELMDYLRERIVINSEVLASWREKIELQGLNVPEWRQLIQILEKAFDTLATSEEGKKSYPGRLIEATDQLSTASAVLGYDYQQVLDDCLDYGGHDKNGVYSFEKPYTHNNRLKLPFRAATELLELLSAKSQSSNPPRFTRADDGSFSLMLHYPRHNLIETLQSKTMLLLDATVSPTLKKMVFPSLNEVCYPVAENVHVTQITSGLYSKRDLYNAQTRQRVSEAVAAFAAPGAKHLTIMPKRFEEGEQTLQAPKGSQVEHWGMHRATNRYSDCDSLALVGHHIAPIDHIRADVECFRAFAGLPQPANRPTHKLRLYNHLLPNGYAVGRWCKADPDPDVQAALEHEYAAQIIQAKGRLRAAVRPANLPPARILILCNEPVVDERIDQLVTTDEIRTNPPKEQDFICNIYMKSPKNGGLVPTYTSVMNSDADLDPDLIQDETPQSQSYEPDDPWSDSIFSFKKLE